MTIAELITKLQDLPYKDRKVYILDSDTDWLLPIEHVGAAKDAPWSYGANSHVDEEIVVSGSYHNDGVLG